MKSILLCVGILLLFVFPSCKQAVDKEVSTAEMQAISQTLMTLSEDWISAIQNNDYEQLDQILSEDLVFYGNGEVFDKPWVVKHYIEDVPDYDSISLLDMIVHV